MKALSTTILIVVTAIVILIAALVVLTIFGGGIGTVSTVTSFRSQCITQCQLTCKMGGLPPTWEMSVKVQGTDQSCGGITNIHNTCSGDCGTGTTSTTSSGTDCSQYNNNAGPCAAAGCQFCSKSGNVNYGKCLSSAC